MTTTKFIRSVRIALACRAVTLHLAGRGQATPDCPIVEPVTAAPATAPAPAATIADRQTWDITTMLGERVGYQSTTYHNVTKNGRRLLEVKGVSHFAIERFGQTASQDTKLQCTETPDGQLLELASEVSQGPTPLLTTGRVQGDRLELQTTTSGKPVSATIPWSAGYGGFFGVEESLLRQPLSPGQKRTIHSLGPENEMIQTDLTAGKYEEVKLLAGSFQLLRIDTVMRLPKGQTMHGTTWTDRSGETIKSQIDVLGMSVETYRVQRNWPWRKRRRRNSTSVSTCC